MGLKVHDMVRCPDVFDPGNRILDRFVNISYSWLNRNICTYNHWDNHFYILGSSRKDLLPIPQYNEDNTMNVNVMCCPRCVEKRMKPTVSQTFRLSTSSLSLGVSVPHTTQCIRVV
jgi:hypothetical protein